MDRVSVNRTEMEVIPVDGWVDSKNEFVLFSFCERQFSTLTSYWCTTWVDNMNANKIRKKKHQYEEIEAGGFGRRIKLDLTGYVNKASRGGTEREREREHHRNVIGQHWCSLGGRGDPTAHETPPGGRP